MIRFLSPEAVEASIMDDSFTDRAGESRSTDGMAKQDREKLRKAKARKDKKAQAAKAARSTAKDGGAAGAPTRDQPQAFDSHPLSVNSVGRSGADGGGATPRLPRRSKKG